MKIKNKKIGESYPTFFIADIAANHDGNLNKAIDVKQLVVYVLAQVLGGSAVLFFLKSKALNF